MKRLNLPLILDTFFAGTCAFLLFFTAVRYYTKNYILALVFAVLAMLLFGALAYVYISVKQNKKLILSQDEKAKKLLSLHLFLSTDKYVKDLFLKALKGGAKISGNKIVKNQTAYFFRFYMQPISEDDIAQIIKYKWDREKAVFCNVATAEAAALASAFSIKLICIDEVYKLLKDEGLLPEKYAYTGAGKTGFFKKIKSRFNRKLAAPLFWSGFALIILSYFAFYPLYYIISGSVLLIIAAVCLVINQRI